MSWIFNGLSESIQNMHEQPALFAGITRSDIDNVDNKIKFPPGKNIIFMLGMLSGTELVITRQEEDLGLRFPTNAGYCVCETRTESQLFKAGDLGDTRGLPSIYILSSDHTIHIDPEIQEHDHHFINSAISEFKLLIGEDSINKWLTGKELDHKLSRYMIDLYVHACSHFGYEVKNVPIL